ncbi:ScyD/ScyE family protein [Nocardioides koreensis]|uniref:ScyD/ScyE family protein n=1 Tax=Nocardioides koreensis TaxID=433651 RepID=A0ABN2Z2E8_9ACTN
MHRTTRMTAACAALGLVAAGIAAATTGASAAVAPRTTVASGLVTPLTAAISTTGVGYVSENMAGKLVKVIPGHKPKTLYQAPKGVELGAVSLRKGTVTFSLSISHSKSLLKQRTRAGKVTTVANLGAYEKKHNPDAGITYGFRDITAKCAAKFPKNFPTKYTGIVDTHPYATDSGFGSLWVADAAANAILKVDNGRVSTVAVLPAVPIKISAKAAKANHIPACAAGLKYWFEPVPTDVEAWHGQLYVSALTGGPEDGSFGPQGRLYTISPVNGEPTLLAKGLAGAVGVAVTPKGDVFATELFGNRIVRLRDGSGTPEMFRKAVQPAAIEWSRSGLYATTNALNQKVGGQLVRFGS